MRVCGLCSPARASRPPSSRASTSLRTRHPGSIVVAGGKYTTYRIMARDAIDEAARTLGGSVPESTYAGHPRWSAPSGTTRWVEPAGRAGRGVRAARRADRRRLLHAPRHPHVPRSSALVEADRSLGDPLPGRRGLPARRDRLRRVARGRPAPRRRSRPAEPGCPSRPGTGPSAPRDLRPRSSRRFSAGTPTRWTKRALPPARRGGAHVADDAGRRGRRSRATAKRPTSTG